MCNVSRVILKWTVSITQFSYHAASLRLSNIFSVVIHHLQLMTLQELLELQTLAPSTIQSNMPVDICPI